VLIQAARRHVIPEISPQTRAIYYRIRSNFVRSYPAGRESRDAILLSRHRR
jgi:hypothetical protein